MLNVPLARRGKLKKIYPIKDCFPCCGSWLSLVLVKLSLQINLRLTQQPWLMQLYVRTDWDKTDFCTIYYTFQGAYSLHTCSTLASCFWNNRPKLSHGYSACLFIWVFEIVKFCIILCLIQSSITVQLCLLCCFSKSRSSSELPFLWFSVIVKIWQSVFLSLNPMRQTASARPINSLLWGASQGNVGVAFLFCQVVIWMYRNLPILTSVNV